MRDTSACEHGCEVTLVATGLEVHATVHGDWVVRCDGVDFWTAFYEEDDDAYHAAALRLSCHCPPVGIPIFDY